MKKVSVENLLETLERRLKQCQRHPVVIFRRGRPSAVLIGVEGMDWEQVLLQTDDSFWRLIERRRKERASPLSRVKKRLGIK